MRGAHPDKYVKLSENKLCKKLLNNFSNNLHILHFNARSFYPKFHELCAQSYMEKPDVVCLTETWLSADVNESERSVPG